MQLTMGEFNYPGVYSDKYKIITSISVILVAFMFTPNFFPIFSSMKVKTNSNFLVTLQLGIILTFAIYVFVGIVGILLFGAAVETGTNVLN
jgi:amino acid permease